MKHTLSILAIGLLCIINLLSCSPSGSPEFTTNTVWDNQELDVEGFRIPGMVVTTQGTILAFAEARVNYADETPNHLVLKRSVDGGVTWGQPLFIEQSNGNYWQEHKNEIDPLDCPDKKEVWTNVAPLVDQITGRIFFFYALNEGEIQEKNLQRYTKVFYKYSDDDGLTWSDRTEITDLLKADPLGRKFHMPGPGHGIQLKSGRLLLLAWSRTALGNLDKEGVFTPTPVKNRQYGMNSLYSDDHGKTWKHGSSFGDAFSLGEARIVELDNGDIYMNSRYVTEERNNHRVTAVSHDGGITWTDLKIDTNFPLSSACDAGLAKITYKGKSYLLYSKNESLEGRKKLTVRISEDNGATWPISKVIDKGRASYSDLAVLPDNTILVLYETGKQKPLYCVRTNMEWLLEKSQDEIACDTESIPEIPIQKGTGGAFAGISNNVLIVAGGSYFDKPIWEGGKKCYSDSIFVCRKEKNGYKWIYAGTLPQPVAHGASVSTNQGLICIGGKTDEHIYNNVWVLRWDESKQQVITEDFMPALPQPRVYPAAISMGDYLYVAGGLNDSPQKSFWRLNLKQAKNSQWENVGNCPGSERYGAALIEQSNGENDCLYLFGGKSNTEYLTDAYCYNPSKPASDRWEQIKNLPRPTLGAPAINYKAASIFVFSGSDGHDTDKINEVKDEYRFTPEILCFNTITKEWHTIGELPQGIVNSQAILWNNQIVIPGGELRPGVRTSEVTTISILAKEKGVFAFWDYVTLISYLLLIVWLGYYFSSKNKSSKDFFLGGQKIPFWAAGLSMMAAQVSAIGFMSIPAKSFVTNWSYFAGVMTWFIIVPVVIYGFVPFYRRLNVTSAYEYLEKRFNPFIRKFIAGLYLLFQLLGRSGAIIFLPALALSAVTGMNTIVCIVIIGGLATLYTVLGGMHAVIWIDVIQALVLFGAIFLCIGYVVVNIDGGIGEIVRLASSDDKFSFGRMDLDLTAGVFWVIIIGNIFNRIGNMATDQSVVQRYLTTRNEKETAKALWTDALVSIPWALCVFGLGTALYAFYKAHADLLSPSITNDEIVPYFIGQNLPVGISGIVIAGIFAASMSSVDSSIHSSTTVIMRDFMQGKLSRITEQQNVRLARIITTLLGIMGTAIAVIMTFFDINSVWDIILEFAGLFTGAMTGVFILGIFSTRANGKGAVIGSVASALLLLYVKTFTPLNFFLYSGIGIISCVVIGYLASLLFKSSISTEGLTIYSVGLNKK